MEYSVYTQFLNFLFYLLSRDNPLKGLKITTERLFILSVLLENYDEKDPQKTLKEIQQYTLEYILSREYSDGKIWGSLERYAIHMLMSSTHALRDRREYKQLDASTIEYFFKHFWGNIEYVDCLERNLYQIILRALEYYLMNGDYYYRDGLKSYPVNTKVAKRLLKQLALLKKKLRVSAYDWRIYELEWLLEDREKEIKEMVEKKKSKEKENRNEEGEENEDTKEGE